MTILMINRPRPILQLLAFLAGGFAMGIAVGVIVLFVLRPAVGSAHFTLPRVQIIVGAVLLLNALVVGTGLVGKRGGEKPAGFCARRLEPLATRTRALINGQSLWTAAVAGCGIALPSDRLPRSAGAHRRLGRSGLGPSRCPAAVQRGGVRVRGDPADLLPGGPGPHAARPCRRFRSGCARAAAAPSPCCWPSSAAYCSERGWPACRT